MRKGNPLRTPRPLPPKHTSRSSAGRPLPKCHRPGHPASRTARLCAVILDRHDTSPAPPFSTAVNIDRFLSEVTTTAGGHTPRRLLDIGCGAGRLSKRLYERGFLVTGVDVSSAAVGAARELAVTADPSGELLRFHEADMAADAPPRIDAKPFDVVVCQLVLSIIGDARQRRNLLRHVQACLAPDGWLFLSASGVSDTINPGYAKLYAKDFPDTREWHTYFSRNADGRVLYATHHFTSDELASLLKRQGFSCITVTTELEASSRRPDEAAYFLYATCRNRSHTPRIRSPISPQSWA